MSLDGAAWRERGLLVLLSVLAVGVQGFHPYAEDGGLYLAGVEYRLDPRLFAGSRAFLTPHLRYSVFAPAVAAMVRATHLPLPVAVLGLQVLSVWMVLAACAQLAKLGWSGRTERRWAVGLVAVGMGLPVAGTSLTLGDPYMTARSFAVPLVLLALGHAVRIFAGGARRWQEAGWWAAWMAGAAALHPLVAATGVLASACLWAVKDGGWRAVRCVGVLTAGVVGMAGMALQLAAGETASSTAAALSRSYWFLSQWRWYEVCGVGAPVLLLPLLVRRGDGPGLRLLVRMGVALTVLATVVALCCARGGVGSYQVARLQPMRAMQVVYFVFVLGLGAWVGRGVSRWSWGARWMVGGALVVPFVVAARATFPASPRVEMTEWTRAGNAWEQAFVWVRGHTEQDALFALDADYISRAGEDAQSFRAVAERSSLPDWSKDGGEASITPAISGMWWDGMLRQRGLSEATDEERRRRLLPAGVTWMVLTAGAKTEMPCPFRNTAVMVCRLGGAATERAADGSR